jgi:hypothetical protein
MRKTWLGVLALCTAGSLWAEPAKYGLEVSVRPQGASEFVCEAQVKDLATGEVVSAPRIVFAGDKQARTKSTSGDLLSEIAVSVDLEASRATVDLKVSQKGMTVATQKVAVQLR